MIGSCSPRRLRCMLRPEGILQLMSWVLNKAPVLPAHLPGHGAAEVERDGDFLKIKEWAGFSRS